MYLRALLCNVLCLLNLGCANHDGENQLDNLDNIRKQRARNYPIVSDMNVSEDGSKVIIKFLESGTSKSIKASTIFGKGSIELRFAIALALEEFDKMEMLLQQGLDVNLLGEEKCSFLQWAALCGKLQSVEWLLKKGADPFNGISILHGACKIQDVSLLKLLIKHGVDVNKKDEANFITGESAIFMAAVREQKEHMKLLIAAGADIDFQDGLDGVGSTPLVFAARNRSFDAVLFLLENGADPRIKNSYGADLSFHILEEEKRSPIHPSLPEVKELMLKKLSSFEREKAKGKK